MFDWIDTLLYYIEQFWNFVTNIIDGLFTLLEMIPQAVAMGPYLSGLVPGIIGSCIITVISIAVAKLIVGRS